jgi:hypothetical protein
MGAGMNLWSDVSSIARIVQENAVFTIQDTYLMPSLITQRGDMTGRNLRKLYQYGTNTGLKQLAETDDLTSDAFTPALLGTLTPCEYGKQYFIKDTRMQSEAPEDILRDAAAELAFTATAKVESDLVGDLASLTGGTIGAAGTAITWGYMAAAIARARNASKSTAVPLVAVIHGYQAAVLAKSASIAGATAGIAPGVQDDVTRNGVARAYTFMGVPIYQSFVSPNSLDDFTGGVFRRDCLMIDWRDPFSVRPERDESRRGLELNFAGVYAHGVFRPDLGIQLVFDASAPSS